MIGSELLVKFINNKNYHIYGMNNLILGKKKFIQNYFSKKNFDFFNIDLSKGIPKKIINKIKGNLNEIWLLAANSDINAGNQDEYVDFKNTFLTTMQTIKSLEKKIKPNSKISFTSSSAIYGTVKKKYMKVILKFNPETNYGLMKLLSENYLIHQQMKKNFF